MVLRLMVFVVWPRRDYVTKSVGTKLLVQSDTFLDSMFLRSEVRVRHHEVRDSVGDLI